LKNENDLSDDILLRLNKRYERSREFDLNYESIGNNINRDKLGNFKIESDSE